MWGETARAGKGTGHVPLIRAAIKRGGFAFE